MICQKSGSVARSKSNIGIAGKINSGSLEGNCGVQKHAGAPQIGTVVKKNKPMEAISAKLQTFYIIAGSEIKTQNHRIRSYKTKNLKRVILQVNNKLGKEYL